MDQAKAFKENQQSSIRKLADIGNKLKLKEQEYADKLQQSMIESSRAAESSMDQNDFLLGPAQTQKFKMSDEDRLMSQNQDFMNNIIGQRKEDINQIGNIMANINEMAKDIALETR